MLTHGDKTVPNCLEILEDVVSADVAHIGFKDVGVDTQTLSELASRIRKAGAVSYMEVVSTTSESITKSIEVASCIGVDRVLGGQDVDYALGALGKTHASYYPFPGRPVGHPTSLHGSAANVTEDCARFRAAGCAGADLLAYRAVDEDPIDLVRAARAGLDDGYLIVAGSVDSPERISAIAEAGADAFTIGTAIFENKFAKGGNTVSYQCAKVLEWCATIK